MRLEAAFLSDAALRRVFALMEAGGHRAYVVGGAVRNALMGRVVSDVDLATDAPPGRVVELARASGIKAVPTGIEHGTVTLIVDGTAFEITTFRRDVETDGRRAVVAFSASVADDAARRDFTMNALYADAAGDLLDPVGGLADLRHREIRFVGTPIDRIREDYLRILRFFRFLAWYGETSAPEALDAIRASVAGLARVSAERIGAELRKLLAAPDPAPAVTLMEETGVLQQILPGADAGRLARLAEVEAEHGATADWRRRLAALGAADAGDRLRLSRAEAGYLRDIAAASEMDAGEAAYRLGTEVARDMALIRLAHGAALPADWTAQIRRAAEAPLPVQARDLMPALTGPALGRGLKLAETLWIETGFTASKPALIDAALLAAEEP
ncbi:poly(A) polymerase [Paracoccus isoporae]|uniref:Poly(A) polymerase n=1 Tax=Paracoccus isoporae TaxID=591205 RepID=A0A1G6Z807_9RHOB|nr:CCA tRNA nucleotidyltransferase [Paracoccus isoporae]SDD98602.1 poly(A) polymerase [Paracoccus isoporae]